MREEAPLVSIVVPVLDELTGVRWLLGQSAGWRPPWPFELIFVDGGSRDGTAELLQSLSGGVARGMFPGAGGGLASAWRSGLAEARGAVRVTMDGDGVHTLASVPLLVGEIERGADLAIADRYGRSGSGMPGRTWSDRVGSRLAARSWSRRFGLDLDDPLHGFRARSSRLYESVHARLKDISGNVFLGWETAFAAQSGLRVREVPVPYGRRIAGRDKKKLLREGLRFARALSRPRTAAVER